jgi:2-dehydro-3-deoxyphosphogluconate aldolase/(4S)-4-hydroxy-2-oxoglutarate aldolase
MSEELYARIGRCGLVATITLDNAADAVSLANALLTGGMDVMELTLRTESAYDALAAIKQEVPDILAGVGTVLRIDQLERVAELGADFAVAPGMNPKIVARAAEIGIPFAPGICTPSDIERAIELGCRVLKFFPSEPCGGLKYLQSMAAPYMHLGLKYIPLGGVNVNNLSDYLTNDLVLAAGGSWLAPRDAIEAGDWDAIMSNTKQAVELVNKIRGL